MGLLEKLREARRSHSTVYMRFIREYADGERIVHLFFEGKDDASFYARFAHSFLPKDYDVYFYYCKNKKGVLKLLSTISKTDYAEWRVMFFVDRDLDDITSTPNPSAVNLFVTKGYSLENYIACRHVFRRCLVEMLYLYDDQAEIDTISAGFISNLTNLVKLLRPVMLWLAYRRREAIEANAGNFGYKTICTLDEQLTVKIKDRRGSHSLIALIENACRCTHAIGSYTEMKSLGTDLNNLFSDSHSMTRGKYILEFMVNYINLLPNVINNARPSGTPPVVLRVPLGMANAVEILGPRCKCPSELEDFLKSRFALLPS